MNDPGNEKPALLIIDMVKDTFKEAGKLPITPLAERLIYPINRLIGGFRVNNWPIVFSTDAFNEDDFIFKAKMKPHSLAGTKGAEVIDELDRKEDDLWLPKPRFSAFFKTGLEHWLRDREVTLCAVTGIATNFCILTTALDAVCHDFKTALVEDCTAASSEKIHRRTLDNYRRNPIYPLLRVTASKELMRELTGKGEIEYG
ncbi:isochorismatase [Desulfosarcina widdelii]|uniref:Isochorismatase n=1 Tax=Desulfosarcina widdelii TaxID=947919 RepID=A0A5K7Z7R7_9BACT|nr:isochorismatase family cysteine hydrolase [Desulfosarcina widdelii]BBO77846.1 isochorismatase [Desulfosarcina widdelii]